MPAPRVATTKIRYTNLRRRSWIATPRLSIRVYLGDFSKNIQVQILYILQRTVFSKMAQPEKQRHFHAMLMSNNNACKLARNEATKQFACKSCAKVVSGSTDTSACFAKAWAGSLLYSAKRLYGSRPKLRTRRLADLAV